MKQKDSWRDRINIFLEFALLCFGALFWLFWLFIVRFYELGSKKQEG